MFDLVGAREELAAEAARLVALPTGAVPLEGWADLIEQTRALTNALAAVQSVAIVRVAAFDERDLEDGTVEVTEHPLGHVALDGPSVVAGRLGCTEQTAGVRVEEAIRTVRDLPEVHAAMAAGRVDPWQAKRVCLELCEAPPEIRRIVSAALAPWLGRESAPRLADRARRILGRVDTELLRARSVRARDGRGLFRGFDEPGVEQWRLILPAEVAGPLWSSIDRAAQASLADGAAQTIAQARLDALVGMATGRMTGTVDVVITVPGASLTRAARGAARRAAPQRVAEVLAARLAAAPHAQVEVGGFGPAPSAVPAAWLRDLLLEGAATHGRRSSRSGPRVRIRVVECEPATGALGRPLDDDRPLARDGYRPSARTVAFVRARDRRCRFPGCQVAARFCDLDHVRPWPTGPTDPGNLICLCRRNHRVKQRRRWSVRLDGVGVAHWTDPTGVLRSTAPPDQCDATLPLDLQVVHADRGDLVPTHDLTGELERARVEQASVIEDRLTHVLIRETGEVPDFHADLDPQRRRARRRRLLDTSAPLSDAPSDPWRPRVDRLFVA